jgi:PhnB protein
MTKKYSVNPYLFFTGRCEEAIEFYRDVFGAEVAYLMRFKEGPTELVPFGGEEKIFHATLKFGDTNVNMSDTVGAERLDFGGFALLAHLEDIEQAENVFSALASEGDTQMPLQQTFWATRYGIVKDKFGITWKTQVN